MKNPFELYEKGLFQELIHSIDKDKFSAVGDPRLAHILAAAYFQTGQYAESLLLLKEIESCFSTDSDYLSLYGACLRRCGDLDGARTQLELALEIKPMFAPIRNNYANLLIDLGDYTRAQSILEHLLSDNPNYKDAQVNLQRLKERQRVHDLNPPDSSAFETAKWSIADPLMLAFGEDEVKYTRPKASSSSQVQSDLNGKLPPLKQQQIAMDKLSLAFKAVQEGRHEFALQLCSQIHQSLPTLPALYECISDAYIALQRFTEAETCLLHALQLGAKSFKLFANLSSILCLRFDFALAQHYLEHASLLDESNPLLSNLRLQIANSHDAKSTSLVRFDQEWLRPELTLKQS